MAKGTRRRSVAQKIEAIAATVNKASIDEEMGAMCRQSYFDSLCAGEQVAQQSIDDASQAFTTLTDRLMPAALVHEFIEQACAMRLQADIDQLELIPGFTADESIAGGDAAARRPNPMKKFTRREALSCLQWNCDAPEFPVAVAHLIKLIQTYNDLLCNLVARHSAPAAEKLSHFAKQWASKNVLKFVNIATFVSARRKAAQGPLSVEQAVVADAMNLLNHSGAFTWEVQRDAQIAESEVRRIHCPAQSFLHKLIVNEGSLMTVFKFIQTEASRKPCDEDLATSLAFVREFATTQKAQLSSATPSAG